MALVTLRELLVDARKSKYAVGGFTVWNLESALAVVETAEELRSPAILMFGPVEDAYVRLEIMSDMLIPLIQKAQVPLVLHLDHAVTHELLRRAIDSSFSSVMFDGSGLAYDDNVRFTREAVVLASAKGVSVEGELGAIGGPDETIEREQRDSMLTDPEQVKDYVEATQVDALAVSIGTKHGHYGREPELDLDRLAAISEIVDLPLVMHGGSGVPDNLMRKAIALGISKVNICTELKDAVGEGIRSYLRDNSNKNNPLDMLQRGSIAVREIIRGKMELLGSVNRA